MPSLYAKYNLRYYSFNSRALYENEGLKEIYQSEAREKIIVKRGKFCDTV